MVRKIFNSIFLVATSVLLITFFSITLVLYNRFSTIQKKQLATELSLVANAVEINGETYLKSLKSKDYRISWIDDKGYVLYDTHVDISTLENHLGREEIKEAIEFGKGESSRYSDTLTEKTMYCAIKLKDNTVLRISVSTDSIWASLENVAVTFVIIFLIAIVISLILAKSMAKGIVNPLNELNLDAPLENEAYEELSPLLSRIYKQHNLIDEQVNILRERTHEFEQIIFAMNEGLVLVDEKNVILSINRAAKDIFDIKEDVVGKEFLRIDHNLCFSKGFKSAFESGHSEFFAYKNGREYQFNISRIQSDNKILGAVLLAFDITEAKLAQKNRKEFTANVSHELKTPLQSILGSAELIENGLVKPDDIPHFVKNIRMESTRLLTLINDIIRLSELDEKLENLNEIVNLKNITEEVFKVLANAAAQKKISLYVEGEGHILGVSGYIYEIIYNLCDNGIRYNVEGGKVNVKIKSYDDSVVLKVTDTGIGIAKEHHSRIFERFYRVDKSHSKETGGTGLGLSIVKHAVLYHEGKIEMVSNESSGTEFTIVFPIKNKKSS